jgi:hypothetical protein
MNTAINKFVRDGSIYGRLYSRLAHIHLLIQLLHNDSSMSNDIRTIDVHCMKKPTFHIKNLREREKKKKTYCDSKINDSYRIEDGSRKRIKWYIYGTVLVILKYPIPIREIGRRGLRFFF